MNSFLGFVGRVFVVFVMLVLSISCILVALLGYQWLSPHRYAVVEEEVEQTTAEAVVEEEVVTPAVALPSENDPAVCRYREGMGENPDTGILLEEESMVAGPAMVQLDGMTAIAVMPNATYEAPTGAVVWLYEGEVECLMAQTIFFEGKTIEFFSPDM